MMSLSGVDVIFMSLMLMAGSLHWKVRHFFVHTVYKSDISQYLRLRRVPDCLDHIVLFGRGQV